MSMLRRCRHRLQYAAGSIVLSLVLIFVAVDSARVTISYGDEAMFSDWYMPAAWALFALGCQTAAASLVVAHFDRRYNQ